MLNMNGLKKCRIIDLSKPLNPGHERRRLAVKRYLSELTNDYHSDIDIMSHLGTHVEAPYHFRDEWKDILQVPLNKYIGRAIILNLDDIREAAPILPQHLEKADRGRVREGDIILLNSPYFLEPFTEKSNTAEDKRPYVCRETALWLKTKKIKAIGFNDTVSIERDLKAIADFHEILMEDDVLFLEVLKNFEMLKEEIFLLVYFPLPISGLDSCPVRAVAIEGITDFFMIEEDCI